jgi:hypothetical protein
MPLNENQTTCSARSKNSGERCKNPAIKGATVCRLHGGSSPAVRRRANERVQLEKASKLLGIPADVEPTEALLHAVRVSAGDMLTLGEMVNEETSLRPAYERAVDRMAKVSKMALDAGVAERRVNMAERQAADMMRVLQAGLDAAQLSVEQQALAREAMAAEVRRLDHAAYEANRRFNKSMERDDV